MFCSDVEVLEVKVGVWGRLHSHPSASCGESVSTNHISVSGYLINIGGELYFVKL